MVVNPRGSVLPAVKARLRGLDYWPSTWYFSLISHPTKGGAKTVKEDLEHKIPILLDQCTIINFTPCANDIDE